jgi:hypothetical protein
VTETPAGRRAFPRDSLGLIQHTLNKAVPASRFLRRSISFCVAHQVLRSSTPNRDGMRRFGSLTLNSRKRGAFELVQGVAGLRLCITSGAGPVPDANPKRQRGRPGAARPSTFAASRHDAGNSKNCGDGSRRNTFAFLLLPFYLSLRWASGPRTKNLAQLLPAPSCIPIKASAP